MLSPQHAGLATASRLATTVLKLAPLALVSVSTGCMGFYAELGVASGGLKGSGSSTPATAGDPHAVDASAISGGTMVSLNLGADFDLNRKHRVALEVGIDSTSFTGGSAKMTTGGGRWDFNLVSLSDGLKLRGAVGFGKGTGSATATATDGTVIHSSSADGGTAFAGVGIAYYVGTRLVVHAFVGPMVSTQYIPGGSYSGVTVAGKVGVSFVLASTIPDTDLNVPMSSNTDITRAIEAGADAIGCHSERIEDTKHNAYAAVIAKCDGKRIMYLQTAEWLHLMCSHTWEDECRDLNKRVMDAAIKWIDRGREPTPAATAPESAAPPSAAAPPPAVAPSPAPSATDRPPGR